MSDILRTEVIYNVDSDCMVLKDCGDSLLKDVVLTISNEDIMEGSFNNVCF